MFLKGTCQRQQLMQALHDAIVGAGSNWTEISSNKTNDFKGTEGTDGLVFKSLPIGPKSKSVYFNLKSMDLSVGAGNHFYITIADGYTPGTSGTNGIFTKRCNLLSWIFCRIDPTYILPTTLFDYSVDVQDHRILITIRENTANTQSRPAFLYIGYPEPSTNIEGPIQSNIFMAGSALGSQDGNPTQGFAYWHKTPKELYFKRCNVICNTNASNPTDKGDYLLTPFSLSGDNDGYNSGTLGILTGIFGLPATNIINEDIITVGSDVYKVFDLYQLNGWNGNYDTYGSPYGFYNSCSIPTRYVAIKMN